MIAEFADPADTPTSGRRRRAPRRGAGLRAAALGACFGLALFACGGDDEFDPAGGAERGIYEQIYTELELESEVTCQEPTSTVVGTTFSCHAEAEDGTKYDFTAEILENRVIGTKLD